LIAHNSIKNHRIMKQILKVETLLYQMMLY